MSWSHVAMPAFISICAAKSAGDRSALVHWVEKHWRRRPDQDVDDPSALVEVRRHLRGEKRFVWNGLSCEVVPISSNEGGA